jgi:hypothetical protein
MTIHRGDVARTADAARKHRNAPSVPRRAPCVLRYRTFAVADGPDDGRLSSRSELPPEMSFWRVCGELGVTIWLSRAKSVDITHGLRNRRSEVRILSGALRLSAACRHLQGLCPRRSDQRFAAGKLLSDSDRFSGALFGAPLPAGLDGSRRRPQVRQARIPRSDRGRSGSVGRDQDSNRGHHDFRESPRAPLRHATPANRQLWRVAARRPCLRFGVVWRGVWDFVRRAESQTSVGASGEPPAGGVIADVGPIHSLLGSSSSSPENSGVMRRECGYTRSVL